MTPALKNRNAFTLVELLMVMAIITLLTSLLLPTIFRARDFARKAVCTNNLKELGAQMFLYAGEHKGVLLMSREKTSGTPWPHVYEDQYMGVESGSSLIFQCPSTETVYSGTGSNSYHRSSYGFAYRSLGDYDRYRDEGRDEAEVSLSQISRPKEQIVYLEALADGNEQHRVWYGAGNEAEWPQARHFDLVNSVFADGHVALVDLNRLLWPDVITPSPLELDLWKEMPTGLY